MSENITIALPDELAAEVSALSRTDGISGDQVVLNAVEAYVEERRFLALRARVVRQARGAGWITDEDVLRRIS